MNAQSFVRSLGGDGFGVVFNGRECSPTFNSKGAAQAYLDALNAGTRQPEYASADEAPARFSVNADGETFCVRCELRASVAADVPLCPECDATQWTARETAARETAAREPAARLPFVPGSRVQPYGSLRRYRRR